MEAQSKVAVDNLALDQLQVLHHKDLLGGDVYHFSVYHAPTGARGFGSDFSESLALKKAYNELVERYAVRVKGALYRRQTSNGFASHDSYLYAGAAAGNELLERDAIMLAWLA